MTAPGSLSRVDRIVGAWSAMAAHEARREPGPPPLTADLSVDEVEVAGWLCRLELEVEVAGLEGRVEDLDAEVEEARTEQHRAELAAWGSAAVVFAHATEPGAGTVLAALDAMTPTEWLVFECLAVTDRGGLGEVGST